MRDFMSEAREKYYKLKHELEHLGHDGLRGEIEDYIEELQQENKQLKESQKQKQIIKLCERLDKAEQHNKHLISTIKNILNQTCREDIWKIAEESLVEILK